MGPGTIFIRLDEHGKPRLDENNRTRLYLVRSVHDRLADAYYVYYVDTTEDGTPAKRRDGSPRLINDVGIFKHVEVLEWLN